MLVRNQILATLAFGVLTANAQAQNVNDERNVANLLALSEATLTSVILVKESYPSLGVEIAWEGEFSDTSWSAEIYGESVSDNSLSLTLAGMLPPVEDEDWLVSFFGSGEIENEPILILGDVYFDSYNERPRSAMYITNVVRIGENSSFNWLRASEILIGGSLGAAGGLIVAPPTAGASLVLGLNAILAGSASAIAISNEYRTSSDSDSNEVEEFHKPDWPSVPDQFVPGQQIEPNQEYMIAGVSLQEQTVFAQSAKDGIQISASLNLTENTFFGFIRSEEN